MMSAHPYGSSTYRLSPLLPWVREVGVRAFAIGWNATRRRATREPIQPHPRSAHAQRQIETRSVPLPSQPDTDNRVRWPQRYQGPGVRAASLSSPRTSSFGLSRLKVATARNGDRLYRFDTSTGTSPEFLVGAGVVHWTANADAIDPLEGSPGLGFDATAQTNSSLACT
jgi:hypothetical protein